MGDCESPRHGGDDLGADCRSRALVIGCEANRSFPQCMNMNVNNRHAFVLALVLRCTSNKRVSYE